MTRSSETYFYELIEAPVYLGTPRRWSHTAITHCVMMSNRVVRVTETGPEWYKVRSGAIDQGLSDREIQEFIPWALSAVECNNHRPIIWIREEDTNATAR